MYEPFSIQIQLYILCLTCSIKNFSINFLCQKTKNCIFALDLLQHLFPWDRERFWPHIHLTSWERNVQFNKIKIPSFCNPSTSTTNKHACTETHPHTCKFVSNCLHAHLLSVIRSSNNDEEYCNNNTNIIYTAFFNAVTAKKLSNYKLVELIHKQEATLPYVFQCITQLSLPQLLNHLT